MASCQVVRCHNQIHVFPCLLATRVQFEKHGSVSSAAIPAVGVASSRERREPLAQRRTWHTYIKSGRHESDAACAYPYSPRRELNRRDLRAYDSVAEAKASIGHYLAFYNS